MSRLDRFNNKLSPKALAQLWAGERVKTTAQEIEGAMELVLTVHDGEIRDSSGSLWLDQLKDSGLLFEEVYDTEFDTVTLVAQSTEIVLCWMTNGVMYMPFIQVIESEGWIQVFSQAEYAAERRFKRVAA